MVKYIHEGRFGAPKTWKTGAVLDSYPTPILYFGYDSGGHEITRRKYQVFTPKEFMTAFTEGKLHPEINVVDLSFKASEALESTYLPSKDKDILESTVLLINHMRGKPLPFKTWVCDPVTEMGQAVWRHQAVTNPGALADPRKWAGNIGMKLKQIIDYVNSFPCNTVFIFHTEVNKDETTSKVFEQPMIFSNLRNSIAGMFTQFFYQQPFGKDIVLRVKPFELVNGIGTRWPRIEGEMIKPPTFETIYGKEPDVFK